MNHHYLNDLDKRIVEKTGFGQKVGFGKKPALMIIDAQKKFVGLEKPILESMEVYPLSIGEIAYRAMDNIKKLLDEAREHSVPVFYSTSGFAKNEMAYNTFAKKRTAHERSAVIPHDQHEIPDIIKPLEGEAVVHKRFSSPLFGTPLVSFFQAVGCDTIIVTGFVTSGCIRAFVVDAASYNFKVSVVEDCVADRFNISHEISLFDMGLKHADIVQSSEVLQYFSYFEQDHNK